MNLVMAVEDVMVDKGACMYSVDRVLKKEPFIIAHVIMDFFCVLTDSCFFGIEQGK